jgi:hypothetical protein
MNIDTRVEAALQVIKSYAPEICEWQVLKRELMKELLPSARKLFSTRDQLTKRQNFNDFEKLVAERWREITGNDVIFRST